MGNKKLYEIGELLWRITDNALFEITRLGYVNLNNGDRSLSSYVLKCVNNMNTSERVNDHESEVELEVSVDIVHAKNSIYTLYQPSKPKKGQHVWNKDIIDRNKEFIVEAVESIPGRGGEDIPCKSCHNGVCEQCGYGYRSKEDILKEIGAPYKKPETIYTMVGIDGREQYKANDCNFADTWSMLPPYYEEIDKFVKSEMKSIRDASLGADDQSETEAEDIVNDRIEKEAVDTGTTIKDSYETWKSSLKVVNIPKFDLNYFQRGLGYHVHKVTNCYPGEFYGIMVEASEDILKIMKLGTNIHFESTEIIEIPLKEYMNGEWRIVRLVEDEK